MLKKVKTSIARFPRIPYNRIITRDERKRVAMNQIQNVREMPKEEKTLGRKVWENLQYLNLALTIGGQCLCAQNKHMLRMHLKITPKVALLARQSRAWTENFTTSRRACQDFFSKNFSLHKKFTIPKS